MKVNVRKIVGYKDEYYTEKVLDKETGEVIEITKVKAVPVTEESYVDVSSIDELYS